MQPSVVNIRKAIKNDKEWITIHHPIKSDFTRVLEMYEYWNLECM